MPPEYGSTNEEIEPFATPRRNTSQHRPHFRDTTTLWDDIKNLNEESIPQGVVVGSVVSVVCAFGAFVYYRILYFFLDLVWKTLPETLVVPYWPESTHVLWIPLVTFVMCLGVGLTVILLGEPGDLAFTISCVHKDGFIPIGHVPPMLVASLFSIVGGYSVGPEAPLVAICAALGGFVSRTIFRQTNTNVIRKHTLMGMSGVLAAFFGCPLGGSLFALEVCSRFGVEYFEHSIEAIFCGTITVGLFRAFANLPLGPIWTISTYKVENVYPSTLLTGAGIGLLGALVGMLFTKVHWRAMSTMDRFGLLDNKWAVWRALIGCTVISLIGMYIPQTLFWGEEEFQFLSTLAPANQLPNVFPTSGLIGFEMDSFWHCFLVGAFKIVAISISVAGGYRGGVIFPFFTAGAAFGRVLTFIFPSLPPALACLCFAAGINVSITKTSLASAVILTKLAGECGLLPAILAASLTSLIATSYMPFIKTQVSRSDIVNNYLAYSISDFPTDTSDHDVLMHLQQLSFLVKGPPTEKTDEQHITQFMERSGSAREDRGELYQNSVGGSSHQCIVADMSEDEEMKVGSHTSNYSSFTARGFM